MSYRSRPKAMNEKYVSGRLSFLNFVSIKPFILLKPSKHNQTLFSSKNSEKLPMLQIQPLIYKTLLRRGFGDTNPPSPRLRRVK